MIRIIIKGPKTTTANTTNLPPSRTGTPTQNTRQECHQSSSGAREDNCSQKICQNLPYGRTSSNISTKSREPSRPQDELLEIINDFKNNVFTISEVERLVENWQKRNDVQQSFKDKQRQLMAMREEYDRIQKRMKEEMKTPTPFDKIRKFFSKGKKGECYYTFRIPPKLFLSGETEQQLKNLSSDFCYRYKGIWCCYRFLYE